MSPIILTFDLTDAMASRASREAWLAHGRKLFTIGLLVLVAVDTVIFVLAVRQNAHWLWVTITGIPPVLLVIMIIIWSVMFWWLPRAARQKLAHLPHRQVTIQLNDADFVAETATERMAVNWIELKELRELRSFWVVSLKGGAEFPLPKDAVTSDALALLRRK